MFIDHKGSKWRGPPFAAVLFGAVTFFSLCYRDWVGLITFILSLTLSSLCVAGWAWLSQLTKGGGRGDKKRQQEKTLFYIVLTTHLVKVNHPEAMLLLSLQCYLVAAGAASYTQKNLWARWTKCTHCRKLICEIPVPRRDVTNQTLPGRELFSP